MAPPSLSLSHGYIKRLQKARPRLIGCTEFLPSCSVEPTRRLNKFTLSSPSELVELASTLLTSIPPQTNKRTRPNQSQFPPSPDPGSDPDNLTRLTPAANHPLRRTTDMSVPFRFESHSLTLSLPHIASHHIAWKRGGVHFHDKRRLPNPPFSKKKRIPSKILLLLITMIICFVRRPMTSLWVRIQHPLRRAWAQPTTSQQIKTIVGGGERGGCYFRWIGLLSSTG